MQQVKVCVLLQSSLKTRTIHDEIEADPKLAAEIDEEISKGSYY